MRIVDLHVAAERPIDLVLHPRLTVITGDRVAVERVVEALRRAFVLAGTEVTGTIDYSGYHTPLDPTGVVSLDLPGEGLRALGPADLPHPSHERHEHHLDELLDRQQRWEAVVSDLATEVARRRRRLQATEAAAAVGREELVAAETRRQALGAELAGHGVDPARFQEAEAELTAEIGARNAAVGDAVAVSGELERLLSPGGEVATLRMGDDVTDRKELLADAQRLGLVRPETASAVSGWLTRVHKGNAERDPAVEGMLDEVRDLERRWQELSTVGVEDEPAVVEARGRHEALSARLAALEELSASGILADRARDEIDAAHGERLEAEEGRHRGASREQAADNEVLVCGRYGFDSYLDYTIALSTRSVGDAVQATLDRVRAEAVGAADALEAVRDEAAARRHRLTEQRAEARLRLTAQIGEEAESLSSDALRRIPALAPELSLVVHEAAAGVTARRAELADAISRHEALLEESSRPDERRGALEVSVSQEDARIEALAPLVQRAEAESTAAGTELEAAEDRQRAGAAELAACARDLAALSEATPAGFTGADVPAVIAHVSPMLDPPGPEPLPVLMTDTYTPLGEHAVAALEATMVAAVRVQLIYVSRDPVVVAWADGLPGAAGNVVRLERPGWLQRHLPRRHRDTTSTHR